MFQNVLIHDELNIGQCFVVLDFLQTAELMMLPVAWCDDVPSLLCSGDNTSLQFIHVALQHTELEANPLRKLRLENVSEVKRQTHREAI